MTDEFNALQDKGIWSLVPQTLDTNVVGCKWVFCTKYIANRFVARYKARLVAKGYRQIEGFNFTESFSFVVKPPTIHVILTLVANFRWTLHQIDAKNAFLHDELREKVYVSQSVGFIDTIDLDHACLLHKSLYGLKQALCAWYDRFTNYLLTIGFVLSSADPSLFV